MNQNQPTPPLTGMDKFLHRLGFRRKPSFPLGSLGISMMMVATAQIAYLLATGDNGLLGFGVIDYLLLIPPTWLIVYLALHTLPFLERFRDGPPS